MGRRAPRQADSCGRSHCTWISRHSDNKELAALAADGNEGAVAELLRRYQRPIFPLVYRMVRDRALAEDLAQEALIRAFNAVSSYDP
jgi:DNA-directed RNA polymerase specialized sigma24 family protein